MNSRLWAVGCGLWTVDCTESTDGSTEQAGAGWQPGSRAAGQSRRDTGNHGDEKTCDMSLNVWSGWRA